MRSKVVLPGEGEALTVVGDVLSFKLTAADTGDSFLLAEGRVAPEGGPPPHMHGREDELFCLIEGAMDFARDDTRYRLAPGDAAWAPRNVPHAFRNAGALPMKFLVIATPTNFEQFYRTCGLPVRKGEPPPTVTGEDVKRLMEMAPKFGLTVLPQQTFPHSGRLPEKPAYWVLGEFVEFKLISEDTGGNFCFCIITSPPGGGPPPHSHRACEEIFYILDGRYEFLIGDAKQLAGPGTTVFVRRGTVHCYKNVGAGKGRFVSIHTPGGFERFFVEAGTLCADPSAPPPLPPDPGTVMALIDNHGMDLAGKPS